MRLAAGTALSPAARRGRVTSAPARRRRGGRSTTSSGVPRRVGRVRCRPNLPQGHPRALTTRYRDLVTCLAVRAGSAHRAPCRVGAGRVPGSSRPSVRRPNMGSPPAGVRSDSSGVGADPARSQRSTAPRGDQLEPVSPRVADVEPPLARDLRVVRPATSIPAAASEAASSSSAATVSDDERRVCLRGRPERLLDADVQLRRHRARTSSRPGRRGAAASRSPAARAARRRTRAPASSQPAGAATWTWCSPTIAAHRDRAAVVLRLRLGARRRRT